MTPKRRWWLMRLRAVSQRITWFLGTRCAETFPLVFVVGHPKSGTVWASQLIADCLQLPFPRYSYLPIGFPAVVHGHHGIWKSYPRAVYVVRDPRDVMVSWYFHGLRLGNKDVRKLRGPDGRSDPDDVAANLPGYIERSMRHRAASGKKMNWAQHVRTYLENKHDRVALLKYEELLTNGPAHLAQAVEVLTEGPADMERVQQAIDRFSFQKQAKRKPGEEDRSSFLRKGQSGDWRNHFSREAAEILDRYCGEMMIQMGYIEDRNWIEQCPPLAEMAKSREQVHA